MVIIYFLLALPAIISLAALVIQRSFMPPQVNWRFLSLLLLFTMIASFSFIFSTFYGWEFRPYFKLAYCIVALFLGPSLLFYHQSLFYPTTDFKLRKPSHFTLPVICTVFFIFLVLNIDSDGGFTSTTKNNAVNSLYVSLSSFHLIFYLFYTLYNQEAHRTRYIKWYTELERTNGRMVNRMVWALALFAIFSFLFLGVYRLPLYGAVASAMIFFSLIFILLIFRLISSIRKQSEIIDARRSKMKTHHLELGIEPISA